MKIFRVIVPTVVVAQVVVSQEMFDSKYDGCPSKLEKFVKESKPEYAKCTTSWAWIDTGMGSVLKMSFFASGDAVLEESSEKQLDYLINK